MREAAEWVAAQLAFANGRVVATPAGATDDKGPCSWP